MMISEDPPAFGCAQLATVKPPVAIVSGENSCPFFRIADDATAKCMPQAEHIVAPGGDHLWLGEEPLAFSEALRAFIRRHWGEAGLGRGVARPSRIASAAASVRFAQ